QLTQVAPDEAIVPSSSELATRNVPDWPVIGVSATRREPKTSTRWFEFENTARAPGPVALSVQSTSNIGCGPPETALLNIVPPDTRAVTCVSLRRPPVFMPDASPVAIAVPNVPAPVEITA